MRDVLFRRFVWGLICLFGFLTSSSASKATVSQRKHCSRIPKADDQELDQEAMREE